MVKSHKLDGDCMGTQTLIHLMIHCSFSLNVNELAACHFNTDVRAKVNKSKALKPEVCHWV